MPINRNKDTGRFIALGPSGHEAFMEKHPISKDWLINKPEGTKIQNGAQLLHFCEATGISLKMFWKMNRRK